VWIGILTSLQFGKLILISVLQLEIIIHQNEQALNDVTKVLTYHRNDARMDYYSFVSIKSYHCLCVEDW